MSLLSVSGFVMVSRVSMIFRMNEAASAVTTALITMHRSTTSSLGQ